MKTEKFSFSMKFPIESYFAQLFIIIISIGGLLLGFFAAINIIIDKQWPLLILLGVYIGLFLYFGVCSFLTCFSHIRITETKIILQGLLGFQKVVPIQNIKLFGIAKYRYRATTVSLLAASHYTQAELTQLWEERMRKGIFSRGDLPFIKRRTDWENQFPRQYLMYRAKQQVFFPWKDDLVWFAWDTKLQHPLMHFFPQIPWLQTEDI